MRFAEDIKGIIFDCDGVLLDSLMIWEDLGARYLRSKGKVPEEGLAETLFSMSLEQGAEYLNRNYDLGETAEEIGQGLQDMLRDFYFYEVLAKPGAAELRERPRRIKLPERRHGAPFTEHSLALRKLRV